MNTIISEVTRQWQVNDGGRYQLSASAPGTPSSKVVNGWQGLIGPTMSKQSAGLMYFGYQGLIMIDDGEQGPL